MQAVRFDLALNAFLQEAKSYFTIFKAAALGPAVFRTGQHILDFFEKASEADLPG